MTVAAAAARLFSSSVPRFSTPPSVLAAPRRLTAGSLLVVAGWEPLIQHTSQHKTDTASVLQEATVYIKHLQDQIQAAKICNNLAMAVSMLGVSEAFALGQSLGIKASTLTSIFNSSSARCWSRYKELCISGL